MYIVMFQMKYKNFVEDIGSQSQKSGVDIQPYTQANKVAFFPKSKFPVLHGQFLSEKFRQIIAPRYSGAIKIKIIWSQCTWFIIFDNSRISSHPKAFVESFFSLCSPRDAAIVQVFSNLKALVTLSIYVVLGTNRCCTGTWSTWLHWRMQTKMFSLFYR